MRENSSKETSLSGDFEKHLGRSLASSGLRMPYVKPRMRALRRAVFYVVAELVDAERLSEPASR